MLLQYAKHCDDFRARNTTLLYDYIAGMDELAQAPDAPETERRAFQAWWGAGREVLVHNTREMDLGGQEIVTVMKELATYYDQAKPPLLTPAGASTPTEAQGTAIRKFAQRGARASARVKAAMDALDARAASERETARGP
jgi:hypothetical protein